MTVLQPSLLELGDPPGPRQLGQLERTELGRGAWLEFQPAWMAGASELFHKLEAVVDWRAERRPMYDRVVDVPRLVSFFEEGAELPDRLLSDALSSLNDRYAEELGERLVTVGLCLYRDGRDSVAWHGDTIGRAATHDTIVAICSLGAPRRFLVRPRGGGPSTCFNLASGDLLVMGGSCQRTFEHAVPKTCRPVGPRISVQFRSRGVR
jgi:alkylated DNA repair dioxygenase AlkB